MNNFRTNKIVARRRVEPREGSKVDLPTPSLVSICDIKSKSCHKKLSSIVTFVDIVDTYFLYIFVLVKGKE